MIYTLSLNPAVDYDIYFGGFRETGLNFADSVNYRAAGKGINVSKMLKNLGIESTVLGFSGGFTGRFIKDEMERLCILSDFTDIEGTTRINTKLNSPNGESEVTGISPEITSKDMDKLYVSIRKIQPEDILILTGSIPKSLPGDVYNTIAKFLPDNVKTVLDTRGNILKKNICNNELIKPNIEELGEMYGRNIEGVNDIAECAGRLIEAGVSNVIVSMGVNGAVYLNKSDVYCANAPSGALVNSMGAGDSMVAGFVYSAINNLNCEETFKMAVACGSATAFSRDMGSKELALKLFDEIAVKKLDI